jgi:hypothetical protein
MVFCTQETRLLQHAAERVAVEQIAEFQVFTEHVEAPVPAEAPEIGGMRTALPAGGERAALGPVTAKPCVLATWKGGQFSVPSRGHDVALRRKRSFTLPNSPVGRGRERPEKAAFPGVGAGPLTKGAHR